MFWAPISYIPQGLPPSPWNPLEPVISTLNLFSRGGIPVISWLSVGFGEGQPQARSWACTY